MKAVNQEKSSKKLAAIKSVEFNQKLSSQRHISIWESFIYEPGTMQKAITNTWYKLLSRTIVLQLKTSRGFDVSAERKSQSEWRFIGAFCSCVLLSWEKQAGLFGINQWFTAGSLNGQGPAWVRIYLNIVLCTLVHFVIEVHSILNQTTGVWKVQSKWRQLCV